MAKARVPHVALVLLPALLLAAVGVRAVTAEMRASEDAARERARSVASRLARSVDALVTEYAGALPSTGAKLSEEAADAATSHLNPRGAYRIPFMEPGIRSTPTRPDVWVLVPDSERRLAEDALSSARRLAQEPNGAVAAAALLEGTAQVIRRSSVIWALRLAEARYELSVGDRQRALDTLKVAWLEGGRGFLALDGDRYPEDAIALATEIVGAAPPPEWLLAAYEFCTTRPFFGGEPALDPAWERLAPAIRERLDPALRLRALARQAAESTSEGDAHDIAVSLDSAAPRVSVWCRAYVGVHWTLLGGEVPAPVVADRIVNEVRALSSDAGVISVVLRAPDNKNSWGRWNTSSVVDRVVETAPLAEPLSAWRAEAVVARDVGVPPTAWLLGAAVLVTTAALVAGMIALRRSAERSARLAEDRQTFLDHVAHELRTPAAAVQALTEELASGHVTKEREAAYREHLLRESRRLSALVEDTLDLTRLAAGRLAFKMEPADLRDVVRRAVEESDGAGRVIATLPDAPVVRAIDEATLRRAVKNLVENAIRHGGGEAPVRVTLDASNGAASIAVADEGRGIAKEHLPRLFERFYRVPSATHETKGVGLGLALCREVARAHGGDVGVTSAVGKGSTFTIRIPLA